MVQVALFSCTVTMNRPPIYRGKTVDRVLVCLDTNFTNKMVLPEQHGKLFLQDSAGSRKFVYVHWDNGYTTLGQLEDNIPTGKWYVYDHKNRLRRWLLITIDGSSVIQRQEFDRHGNLVYERHASVPF